MPSQIIHVLAGKHALGACGEASLPIVPGVFFLGCQGPDIFSHNRRTKPFALAFSRLLHRRDYGRFCANFARLRKDARSPSVDSWFYGFVTHQAVDRILHPYIVYRSFLSGPTGIPGVPPERFHVFLERILDAFLFAHLEGLSVSAFDASRTIGITDSDAEALAVLIAAALAETYPAETEGFDDLELRVRNAFADTLHFYDMTNPSEVGMETPPDAIRFDLFSSFDVGGAALLHPVGMSSDVDWLNLSQTAWLDPVTGAESSLSVPQLFEIAAGDASKAILRVLSVLAGETPAESLEDALGNGPLSMRGADGKIGTVRFAEPFDLGVALLEQAEKRRFWLSVSP